MAQDSGLLTDSQRSHIKERKTNSAARMARKRARERLYTTATADAPIIYNALLDGTLDPSVTLQDGVDPHGKGVPELATGLRDMVSIVYILAEAADLKADSIIEDGVSQAERGIRESRLDALYQTFLESPESMTLKDLTLLVEHHPKVDKQHRNEVLDRISE